MGISVGVKMDINLIRWINLLIGFYNIYLWELGGWWFNFIIGALNIGVWVFWRNGRFNG
tara:strand:+ start:61 stop:237 length:177 start_codon:yes stop_codon:yes gene_type:complete